MIGCSGYVAGQGLEGTTCTLRPPPVFQATAGAHLKDGVFHITNLYAGAVICWFAREERFEPEQEHKTRERERVTDTSTACKKLSSI